MAVAKGTRGKGRSKRRRRASVHSVGGADRAKGPAVKPAARSVAGPAAKPDDANASDEGKWYSIREAAGYLGVSEPTIYRWMKDGLLSFYKVGGSTRFSQEGLDALVEKTTGLKEAEAAAGRCASCGHGILVDGRLQGTGRLYFKPEKTRFWVFAESMVNVRAKVCAACGFLQLHADPEKLKKLKPERR